ncbi:hypothetical protein FNV43_RR18551 [Rhamnella rubrinervis]|uniref:Uncharacterized protein n=1 Tax=Rhamnella rubrinervis TaxID=2594499 RepID=A0A8K0DZ71_9ROSA|nr:hypothetical protein FNV43_RR18551 [Rhamnella rubrinervis]
MPGIPPLRALARGGKHTSSDPDLETAATGPHESVPCGRLRGYGQSIFASGPRRPSRSFSLGLALSPLGVVLVKPFPTRPSLCLGDIRKLLSRATAVKSFGTPLDQLAQSVLP